MNVIFLTKTIDDRFSILELGSDAESMKNLLKRHVSRFLDKKANVTATKSEESTAFVSYTDPKGNEHTASFNLVSGNTDEFFRR